MTVLVTGSSGFIGFNLSKKLLAIGCKVVGVDNMNNYYDTQLKKDRLSQLKNCQYKDNFSFIQTDLENNEEINEIFRKFKPKKVVNLAAQAGVRHSIENPNEYVQSNLVGFSNILECCRNSEVEHLVYASSSSVYGGNTKLPYSETHVVDHPVSLYAATKRSNELIAHSYSHLYKIPATGLRFFTVYGPWGRPDMALFLFTKAILNGEEIKVFNNGNMVRDFTYIDDIIESLIRVLNKPPIENPNFDYDNPLPGKSWSAHHIFNIGNSHPIQLMEYIQTLEETLGLQAKMKLMPMQPGDVVSTSADVSALEQWTGYKPFTSIKDGIANFVDWYKSYYDLQ
tara:strand:- start:854 stop:1873 length:1020 start_codon:yes stop_codon:yes gene_type:complete